MSRPVPDMDYSVPDMDYSVPRVPGARSEWLARGRRISESISTTKWDLGDWWNARPDKREEVNAAAAQIGASNLAIWQCGWLARVFPKSRRRHPPLSHSHHLEVAALPAEVADALLGQAVAGRWTVARLRRAARRAQAEQAVEAERAEMAADRDLDLGPSAAAWRSDSRRIERECRERLIAAEAAVRGAVDALAALADHPGLDDAHGNSRRAAVERLRHILAPGDAGVDLTPHAQPLLDRIWRHPGGAMTDGRS